MAELYETTMALRFFGDDLDPEEVSALLGHSPSLSARKGGSELAALVTGKTARTGKWILEVSESKPGNLDRQIGELFAVLSNDLSVWEGLASRFQSDLFCGLWMSESNEGLILSSETMGDLASRKITLELDIYGPGKED